MWKPYDEMIAGIPDECTVDDLVNVCYTSFVRSGTGAGTGGLIPIDSRSGVCGGNLACRFLNLPNQ